jgi:hypothetical protein
MDAQDIRNLQEAYLKIYQELDRTHGGATQRGPIGTGIGKDLGVGFEERNKKRSEEINKKKKKTQKEQVDLYDIILSHLLDEGYAETPEAAEAIMVNMSEGWREDIMEKSDDTYLEPNWKKRKKNNEKAIKDMKNDPNHQKYLETVRKKFG